MIFLKNSVSHVTYSSCSKSDSTWWCCHIFSTNHIPFSSVRLKFNVHVNHPEILFKCKVGLSRRQVGPDNLQFKELPVDAYSADPRTIVQIQEEVFSKLFLKCIYLVYPARWKDLRREILCLIFLSIYTLYRGVQ